MNFFKTLLGGIPEDGVLTATFRVDDEFSFQLLTKVGYGFNDKEYLHLFINYYLRTLINLQASPASHVLKTTFEKVILEGFESKSNILEIAEIDDVVSVQKYSPANAREYVATITVQGNQRSCYIKIPKQGYEQDMVFSVFVMLQNLVNILDEFYLDFLKEACSRLIVGMNNEAELKRNGINILTASGSRTLAAAAISSVESLVEQRRIKKIAELNRIANNNISESFGGDESKLELIRKKQIERRKNIQNIFDRKIDDKLDDNEPIENLRTEWLNNEISCPKCQNIFSITKNVKFLQYGVQCPICRQNIIINK